MKAKYLFAVSGLALMMAPALATADYSGNTTSPESSMSRDYRTEAAPGTPASPQRQPAYNYQTNDSELTRDVKRGLNKADRSMRNTADDIRALFIDDEGDVQQVALRGDMTAKSLIGTKIATPRGDTIARVEDILLDADGDATHVIVSDGGMLGIGNKLAAFDYERVISVRNDRVTMNLSQDMIDRAREFSYDRKDADKANVLPANSISVARLLDGNVYNSNGQKVADIDNLTIIDGEAEHLVVSFNKTLGLGGQVAALDFDDLRVLRDGNKFNAQMSPALSSRFEQQKRASVE